MLALSFIIAFVCSLLLHPKIVRVAKIKEITDKPNTRKLQREPVPVLGGVVVFFGIIMAVGLTGFFISYHNFVLYIALMLMMLGTGTLDDINGLSPHIRFMIEITATLILIFMGPLIVNDFHGLWGIQTVDLGIAIPLTLITVVGIINAINLVDGVDGLSSGYCIMACGVFAWYFWETGNMAMTSLGLAACGSLIPFFAFNVFGKKSKMFIGDGGTLLMGIVLSIMSLVILSAGMPVDGSTRQIEEVFSTEGATQFGVVPFTLAVLSFPICDCLRVMTWRVLRHESPFSADKTHLHHAFISMGFSHIQTTLSILGLNALIICLWFILWLTGCSIDCQFYAVVGTTIALNLLFYYCCQRR